MAVMEVQAVVKNLSAGPLRARQVTEWQRYLGQDRAVNDVCELAAGIRTPLRQALGRDQQHLGA
jgi:hypothetical protein